MSNGHQLIDERSLAFGRAIAAKIQLHPELIARANATLQRWMTTASPRVLPTLQEWATILASDPNEIVRVLTATDHRSTRLRQSNPFAGALSTNERNTILRGFRRPISP